MKILAITQARVGSTRLPEKILKTINNETLLEIHLKRILRSKLISKLIVATTTEAGAEKIVVVAKKLGVDVYKGSVSNVLDRFFQAAKSEKPDWVVRLTSDCPLIDPVEIDRVIQYAIDNNLDYASNSMIPTYPDGLDTEVFTYAALKRAHNEAEINSDLEHVTPYIKRNSTFRGGGMFKSDCIMNETDYSSHRITVDTIEDFWVIEKLVHILGTERPWTDYIELLNQRPNIRQLNMKNKRNEGYEQSLKND